MVIRKIDDNGRIAIPKEIRKQLSWFGGTEVAIELVDNKLIIQSAFPNEMENLRFQIKMLVPQKAEKILKILDEKP
jgi:AbrB family looped-hinge helix DNA binding protein